MGKIRPIGPSQGATGALFEYLCRLHRLAGEPSTREIAKAVGKGTISHTTVHAAIRGPGVPRWPVLELVVEQLDGDLRHAKELWLAARGSEDDAAARVPHSFLQATGFAPATVRVTPSGQNGELVVRVKSADANTEVVVNRADRLAMAALFAGYFRQPPAYDPNPHSYQTAARMLGLPRTTVVKRVEYLRARLTKAGVPLMGFNALYNLAEFAIGHGLVSKEDIQQLSYRDGMPP